MNSKTSLLQAFAAVTALASITAMSAQQQPVARQRDNGSTLPTPAQSATPSGTTTGNNTSSTSNDPGEKTPRADVATTVSDSKVSHRDRTFFEKAAKAGTKEVQVSQAVLTNLSSTHAKDFAQTMINDHQQANEQLKALATKKGVALPPETDRYSNKWSGKVKDVDEDYLKEMKEDHKEAVELFEKATKSDDPEIAAFAQKTLPTLQHHLSMLQSEPLKSER